MKAEFRREMNRNYMILTPKKTQTGSYTVRMMAENRMEGLLPFQEKCMDGEVLLCFDITSRQSLARMMEYRSFRAEEIKRLLKDLIITLRSMERFLVDGDQLCLEPDMIYVDPDDLRADFCLFPGEEETFTDRFRKLSRYILDHVDHTDGDAVVLAFALFRAGERENMGLLDLERCLEMGELNSGKSMPVETSSKDPMKAWESGRQPDRNFVKVPDWDEKRPIEMPAEEKGKKKDKENKENQRTKENEKNPLGIPKIVQMICLIAMALLPLGSFMFFGIHGIVEKKWGILAAEGLLMVGSFVLNRKETDETEYEEEEEDWEVNFREEEEREEGGILSSDRADLREIPERYQEMECFVERRENPKEPEMQTMLLTGRQIYPISRKLVSESTGETIPVSYFPFLVGKNKEIADLCLNLPQISRMHAKIEENGESYVVTDLNSTNGTYVNGRLLGNNESCPVNPGETISFADLTYRFL